MHKPHKLVVTGVGHVGSYVLADAMKMNLFGEIATIDILNDVSLGEALDQHHATGALTISNVDVYPGTAADYADADVIIIAAGPSMLKDPENPHAKPDRAILAVENAKHIRQIMRDISAHTQEAVVILITNPLDTMVWIAQNEFNYPENLIWGTGTSLDSARVRRIVADRAGVAPSAVYGFMMGEHGMAAFPVLSHLTVGGIPADNLSDVYQMEPLDPEKLAQEVVDSAYNVLNGKGWTNAGVAQTALAMARAVLLDEKAVFPASTTLRGEFGHDGDVALSQPCVIGAAGLETKLVYELNTWEKEALERSVSAIQAAMRDAGCEF
ncbi:lactate/malate family dehydrogenase [Arcanobacterium hippocoleae]|uniref:L-lactate dehydrogenase n=1 Tax=Arcanobacterium hippocoleae TaxID=149017 RepID=A0ABU1T065_9ACTO|nr:hypothetical protein [Arcanobacterium hippocoleae]MDR6938696.1 L-lactate dehydrogenase [Arcanobacterium hippocoleae]